MISGEAWGTHHAKQREKLMKNIDSKEFALARRNIGIISPQYLFS